MKKGKGSSSVQGYYKGSETAFLAALTSLGGKGVKPPYSTTQIAREIVEEEIPCPTTGTGMRGYTMVDWGNRVVSTARRLAKRGKVVITRKGKGGYLYTPKFGRYANMGETTVGLSLSEVGGGKSYAGRKVRMLKKRMQSHKVHESELGAVLRELSSEKGDTYYLKDSLLRSVGGDTELADVLREIAASERIDKHRNEER